MFCWIGDGEVFASFVDDTTTTHWARHHQSKKFPERASKQYNT